MFKAINAAQTETRPFNTYAEAYSFVMREGDKSKLWGIYAANETVLMACRAQRDAFNASNHNIQWTITRAA